MRIKSSIGLAVGPVDATHWGQVLVLPSVYGVVEIQDPAGNAQEEGVATLSLLGDALSHEISSLRALEDIADRANSPHVQSMMLLLSVGRVVYIVFRGKGNVYLKRGRELASLMHRDGGISGEVRSGDTFLLSSGGFAAILPHEELTHLFDHLPAPEIAEKLTLLLHEKKGGEGSVALVFEAVDLEENQLKDESPPVISQEPVIVQKNDVSQTPDIFKKHDHQPMNFSGFISRVKTYIEALRRDKKHLNATIVVVLIGFFAVSVLLGVIKQVSVKRNQAMYSAMSDAQHALDEGVALIPLNPLKGRERLTTAKQLLDPYMQRISPNTTDGYQLGVLYRKVTDNLSQAMQIVNTTPSLFYDMGLIKKGATATNFAIDGTTLAIGDGATATVYSLDITSKNAQIIAGGSGMKGVSSVAVHGDQLYALTGDAITQFDMSSNNKATKVVKRDPSWNLVTNLTSFGGNLYLLDVGKSRIWKYIATDTNASGSAGFSDIREYLNPDTLPDFSGATSLAIDGSVWVGTTDGKILRFTQGQVNPYLAQGVDPAFGKQLVVYTTDDAKNIYVLDTQNNRVVVLDKDGMYAAQYRWSTGFSPTNIVVSESNKKILLLAGGKIYSIVLK